MPDIWMDVDTAVIVPVNIMPLLDDTDFKSIETAVVYNSAGLAVTWNFVTSAGVVTGTAVTPTTAGVYDWSEPVADKGMYAIEIPASGGASINNDTEGYGWFTGVATGVLPWRGPTIGFRRAAMNDLLVDGSTASTNLEDFFDGTGYAGGTVKLTVDTVKWLGTACATPSTNGVPEVDVTHVGGTAQTARDLGQGIPNAVPGAAGGLMIAGSNAATTFATLTVTGATTFTGNVAYSNGITITQATLNGHGISVTGNGSGHGISATGGATGCGMKSVGRGDAHGMWLDTDAVGNGSGWRATGNGTGHGLWCESLGSGTGISAPITGNITGNLSGSVGSVTGAVGSVTGAVGSVTGLTASNLDTTVSSRATPAQVNTEVLDVLNTDTFAEPGQGAPAATTTLVAKINYIYKFLRNKILTSATEIKVYDDAGTTVDQKSTIADDGTNFTRGEFGSGP